MQKKHSTPKHKTKFENQSINFIKISIDLTIANNI